MDAEKPSSLVPYSGSEGESDDEAKNPQTDEKKVEAEDPTTYRTTAEHFDSESESESDSGSDPEVPVLPPRVSNFEKEKNRRNAHGSFKKDGETKDLPAIEHLKISVKEVDLMPLGHVLSVVDLLVVIQSLPNTPALDLDTALFTVDGKCVGQVFDTFGPVKSPLYQLRFNNKREIETRNLVPKVTVYYAPCKNDLTNFVFTDGIRAKGSDASWLEDHEPPEDKLEYSDDEQERIAKKLKRKYKLANAARAQNWRNPPVEVAPAANQWPLKSPRMSANQERKLKKRLSGGQQPRNQFTASPQRRASPSGDQPTSVATNFWRTVAPPPRPQFQERSGDPNFWATIPPPQPPSRPVPPITASSFEFSKENEISKIFDACSLSKSADQETPASESRPPKISQT